eukprot:tig00020614_g12221.t1
MGFEGMAIGTAIFVILGFLGIASTTLVEKELRALAKTLVLTAAICMWLMWICTYMAQMNPLMLPTRLAEHS